MAEEDDRPDSSWSYDEQSSGLSADDICEQIVGSHFTKSWGERPLNASPPESDGLRGRPLNTSPLESNGSKRLRRSANTMYVGGLTKLADITEALVEQIVPNDQPVHPKIPAELLLRRDEIRYAALEKLGSPQQAKKWLEGPKVSLQGRRPMDLLETLEGCEQAQRMLDDLYS